MKHYVDLLETNWNIGSVQSIDNTCGKALRVSTANKQFYLKRIATEAKALRESDLISFLSLRGLSVAVPIPTQNNNPYSICNEQVFMLYPALSGSTTTDHYSADLKARALEFGKAIAQLHMKLREYQEQIDEQTYPEMNVSNEIERARSNIITHLQTTSLAATILDSLANALQSVSGNLNTQLIHRDCHPSNLLFDEKKVSGYLDFELVRYGPRIFDLCYCATAILETGFESGNKQLRWFEILSSLVKGYQSVSNLSSDEKRSIWYMLQYIQTLFTGFWYSRDNIDLAQKNLDMLVWLYESRHAIEDAIR